jgi:hypothetical protein
MAAPLRRWVNVDARWAIPGFGWCLSFNLFDLEQKETEKTERAAFLRFPCFLLFELNGFTTRL